MTTALYNTPPYIAPQLFSDADAALAQVQAIYRQSVQHLRQALAHFVATGDLPQNVRAFYPQVRIHTGMATHVPRGEALHTYGFVSGPGIHQTTLTAPDLFSGYYRQQFALLLANHGKCLEVGTSQQPIALHFALDPSTHHEGSLTPAQRQGSRHSQPHHTCTNHHAIHTLSHIQPTALKAKGQYATARHRCRSAEQRTNHRNAPTKNKRPAAGYRAFDSFRLVAI